METADRQDSNSLSVSAYFPAVGMVDDAAVAAAAVVVVLSCEMEEVEEIVLQALSGRLYWTSSSLKVVEDLHLVSLQAQAMPLQTLMRMMMWAACSQVDRWKDWLCPLVASSPI